MKGFPLQNLIVVLAALVAACLLLWQVNHAATPELSKAGPSMTPAQTGTPVGLRLRMVDAPQSVEVNMQGRSIALQGDGLEREVSLTLPGPEAALEIHLKATWPDTANNQTMVEVRAAPDGLPEQVQNVWADGNTADEIIRFTWRRQTP